MEAVEFGTYANNGMEADIQERVAAVQRLVGIASKEQMTLEEIRNERLERQ